ncbi:hypothetical protein JCM19241_3295 [Vibrio ishigakensis]|uniref:OmpR/PhoB-type domain-containing protein n=1 Tax=Vibrio ishigakensis TaxID=1481914 RepID=A0A0B8QJV7_9VIBR|nr:hypothetical protein JCM19241_3295 [Vibrio ishigakensis]
MSFYLLNQSFVFNGLTGKLISLKDGQHIQLRSNEWKLLQLFIDNAGKDIDTSKILDSVWHGNRARSSAITAIKNLRCHLRDRVETPSFIQTQVMSGYVFIATTSRLNEHEFQELIAPLKSKRITFLRGVQKYKWLLATSVCNIASLFLICSSLNSLYRYGAFESFLASKQNQKIVPMFIDSENGRTPTEKERQICRALIIDVEQTSRLAGLTTEPSEILSMFPTLVWSNELKESLICRLPSINQ